MFSAARVFSFTAGTLGMLGGVLGSLFIIGMGMPVAVGFLLVLAVGALFGIVTRSSPFGLCSKAWTSISTCSPRSRWR